MSDIEQFINLERYPLTSPERGDLIAALQADFTADGACRMPDFLRPEALAALRAEAGALIPLAYPGPDEATPYFFDYDQEDDETLPTKHPRRRRTRRALAQVAGDLIPENGLLYGLYQSRLLQDFLAEILGYPKLYPVDDPYQCLNVAVMQLGGCQQWHFDTGRFNITLLLQAPEGGGDFEFAPFIRSEAEENYDAVAAVLDGKSDRVKRVALDSGTLMLFAGHYSLHRVTEVTGARPRLQSIFAFAPEPAVRGSYKSSRRHYGERVKAY